MKNKYLLQCVLVLLLAGTFEHSHAQKWYTKSGKISFHSKASLEEIKAVNNSVTAVLDTKNGALQFSVLMRGFEFPKALMQEHFNENYVESHKFPKATFSGSIQNVNSIQYGVAGVYPATVKGNLSIHGITQPIETEGKLQVSGSGVKLIAEFPVTLATYKISIPTLVANKIAETVSVIVDCDLNNMLN